MFCHPTRQRELQSRDVIASETSGICDGARNHGHLRIFCSVVVQSWQDGGAKSQRKLES